MVRTGASSYVRYDWENTVGTAAFDNATHKAFGLNARLGSWTLGHSPKDLPRLNQVEVAQYAYGQQNGSLSVDFVLSNPWIFRALYGAQATTGSGPYVHTWGTTGDVSGAANTILERFTYLSKLSDGKSAEGASTFYKDIINEESQYIFHGGDLANTIEPTSAGNGKSIGVASTTLASGDKFLLVAKNESDLAGGTDDYAYTAGEVNGGYDLFLDTEETEVDFVLAGGSFGTESDTLSKAQKAVAIASARKDCIAFVSPYKGNQIGTGGTALSNSQQRTNTLNFFNNITSSSFAVLDSGYKYMYDRFNDKYRWVATNGDIAGLCVNTSTTNADWISPAGMSRGGVRNVVKLAYNPNKADRDELYQNRINPVVSFPGSGSVLFGDKTALASPSAFDRINVRRLFLNIEKRVGNLGKAVLFELNDEVTRSGFLSNINGYLNDIVAQQGITDFLVVCDESNNTPDVIDRNEFVAELFIKPARSINYVTVTFTATRTGVSFAEVIGR